MRLRLSAKAVLGRCSVTIDATRKDRSGEDENRYATPEKRSRPSVGEPIRCGILSSPQQTDWLMINAVRRKLVVSLLLLILTVAGLSRKANTPRNHPLPSFPQSQLHLRHAASSNAADTAPLLSIPFAPRGNEPPGQRTFRIPVIQAIPRRSFIDRPESRAPGQDLPIVEIPQEAER